MSCLLKQSQSEKLVSLVPIVACHKHLTRHVIDPHRQQVIGCKVPVFLTPNLRSLIASIDHTLEGKRDCGLNAGIHRVAFADPRLSMQVGIDFGY